MMSPNEKVKGKTYTTCITAVNISVAGFVTSSSHLATSEPSRPYTLGTLIPGPVI